MGRTTAVTGQVDFVSSLYLLDINLVCPTACEFRQTKTTISEGFHLNRYVQ